MRTPSVRPALALAVVVTATACGTLVDRLYDGPSDLQPAATSAPAGTERVVCDLRDSGRQARVRFALDLPDDVRPGHLGPRSCTWGHPERVPGEGYTIRVATEVRAVDRGEELRDVYDDLEPDAVEDGDFNGDDTIFDLELEEDVATFGRTVGDRLSWHCYCDGQELITRMAQADGVRVTWSSAFALRAETDAEVEQALTGAGTVGRDPGDPGDPGSPSGDLSGASSSGASSSGASSSGASSSGGPDDDRPPPGTERVVCALDDGGREVRFALDLPDDVRARRANGHRCMWVHTERVRGYSGGYPVTIRVSLADTERLTLKQMYDAAEPGLVDEGEFEGDGTVYALELEADVPVFRDTLGQRFAEHCYCDGQNPIVRAFEADGVRVTWASHADLTGATDREIEQALAAAGVR